MKIGEKISKRLAQLGKNQSWLVFEGRINQSNLSQIIKGKTVSPTEKVTRRLATALEISPWTNLLND